MAFLAERMAAMFLETAMPDLTAGIADALILDGKVVAPATDAAVSSTQRWRRRRRADVVKNNRKVQSAVPPKELGSFVATLNNRIPSPWPGLGWLLQPYR